MEKELLINDILKVNEKYGYVNRKLLEIETDKYDVGWQLSLYGGLKNLCKEIGVCYKQFSKLDNQAILDDAMRVFEKFGKLTRALYDKYGTHSTSVIRQHFGSFSKMLDILGINQNIVINPTREEIIDEVSSFVKENGTTSSTKYRKNGKYSQSTIERLFGSWSNLIKEIGYKPMNEKIGVDYMVKEVKKLYEEYGFLNVKLINDNCDFTYQALTHHMTPDEIAKAVGVESLFTNTMSAGATMLKKVLYEIYGEDDVEVEFRSDWLRNPSTKRMMYVDFYVKSINLAIEYDGQQHYEYISFIHRKYKQFYLQVKRDRLKEKILLKHGIKTIRFKYDEKITVENVKDKINKALDI